MSRRRRFGGAFRRFKVATMRRNHYELDMATTSGTELITPIMTGTETPTDRQISVPTGAQIHYCIVRIQAQTIAAGKYQCMLSWRPGAETLTLPIASYFTTTEPVTNDMLRARRTCLSPPHTQRVVAGALVPVTFRCMWKDRKGRTVQDGDDIVLTLLQNSGGGVTFDTQVYLGYRV